MTVRIEIDRQACEANGVCEELLPEALHLDEADVLRLRLPLLSVELEARARVAVDACPRQALRLVEETQGGC